MNVKVPIFARDQYPDLNNLQHAVSVAALYLVQLNEYNPETLVFGYIIAYSQDGYYHAGFRSRETCCERLNLSVSAYKRAMLSLENKGLIKRVKIESTSKFCYYKIPKAFHNFKGNIQLIFHACLNE